MTLDFLHRMPLETWRVICSTGGTKTNVFDIVRAIRDLGFEPEQVTQEIAKAIITAQGDTPWNTE